MNKDEVKRLDAAEIRCPDLFLVMRQFINANKGSSRYIQINTKEDRAEVRIKQLCITYGFEYKAAKIEGQNVFMLDLRPEKKTETALKMQIVEATELDA